MPPVTPRSLYRDDPHGAFCTDELKHPEPPLNTYAPPLLEKWELGVCASSEPIQCGRRWSPTLSWGPQSCLLSSIFRFPTGREADPVFVPDLATWKLPLAAAGRVTLPSGSACGGGRLSPCGPRAPGPPFLSCVSPGAVILRVWSGPVAECAGTRKPRGRPATRALQGSRRSLTLNGHCAGD